MSASDLNGIADFGYTPHADYLHVNVAPRFGREVGDQINAERITAECPTPIPFDADRHNPVENARWIGYACVRSDAQNMFEDRVVMGQNATFARNRVGFSSTESIENDAMARVDRMKAAQRQRKFEAAAGHNF